MIMRIYESVIRELKQTPYDTPHMAAIIALALTQNTGYTQCGAGQKPVAWKYKINIRLKLKYKRD